MGFCCKMVLFWESFYSGMFFLRWFVSEKVFYSVILGFFSEKGFCCEMVCFLECFLFFFFWEGFLFWDFFLRRVFILGCYFLRRVIIPIATTTSFVQNGHWSSPDWISSVVLEKYFLETKFQRNLVKEHVLLNLSLHNHIYICHIYACTVYWFFWWRQFRLLTNNSGCYAKEFLRKRLLLRLTRCV